MNNSILINIINTLQVLLVIPILGLTIGFIEKAIFRFISKHLGVKMAVILNDRITFIGVVHHELSHALFALISGAKITSMDLFKPKNGTLGSVSISPRGSGILKSIQMTLTAIAPVVTGMISMSLIVWIGIKNNLDIWWTVILIYLFLSILFHSTMSKADLKCALKGLPICVIIIFIVVSITDFSLVEFILKTSKEIIGNR